MSGNIDQHNANLQAIGDDFYESLSDLTLNSRPIISSLTEIAQENVNAAQYITTAVEKRIEKAIPSQKLFAFYLLDSISKNIGSPYTLLFGTNLFQTFTQAFLLVDDQTRMKFIALFKTWKIAKNLSGLPLFPQEPIDKIERFLIRASSVYQQQVQQQSRPSSRSPQILNQQLLTPSLQPLLLTVDKLVELTNQRLNLNPQDTKIRSKLELISQLKVALQSNSVPEASLPAVAKQVDDMMKQEETFLRNSATPQPLQPPQPNLSSIISKVMPSQPNPTNTNSHPISTEHLDNNKNPLGLLNNIINLKTSGVLKTPTPPTANSVSSKPDLSSLISTLKKTGLVKSENRPTIPSNALLKSLLNKNPSTPSSTPSRTTTSQSVDNEFIKFDLNSKNLFNQDPSEVFRSIFITQYPNKCGQCGKRFDTTEKGLNLRRDHLDWHFRMNKKLKDGFVPQSKIWYLDDEQFVNFRDFEIFNKNYDNDDDSSNDLNNKNDEKSKSNSKNYVVVPSDSSDMSCVCGICKETLRGQYDDELGEWIWPNAIESKGKVFHFNCFNEANNKPTTTTTSNLMNLVQNKRKRTDDENDDGSERKKISGISGVDMNLLKSLVKNVVKEEKA